MCSVKAYYDDVSKENICKNQTIDLKNRPICLVQVDDQLLNFYVGPDAHGFITESEDGDYVKAGDQTHGAIKAIGAIDNKDIREEITLVTEGGPQAFKLRMNKYGF